MKAAIRAIVAVAGSLLYWLYAPLAPIAARFFLFGECYIKPNPDLCYMGGDATQLLGFVTVGVVYSLFLWRALGHHAKHKPVENTE